MRWSMLFAQLLWRMRVLRGSEAAGREACHEPGRAWDHGVLFLSVDTVERVSYVIFIPH